MHREMFETTLPVGEPHLMRAATFARYIAGLPAVLANGEPVDARISTLGDSLRADLMRFAEDGGSFELLEVLAACVRHAKRVTIHLECGPRVVPLTVFAIERMVHCPIRLHELIDRHLPTLRVMHVEPAIRRPPGDAEHALVGALLEHHPLPQLLWELAMRGSRRDLLPELTGAAIYRVAPSLHVRALPASAAVQAAVQRLQSERYSLREISAFPGFDRERAIRLLNALYLQAGLIVSRSHPNGLSERWRIGR